MLVVEETQLLMISDGHEIKRESKPLVEKKTKKNVRKT